MTAFKKYVRTKGIKLEADYPFLPFDQSIRRSKVAVRTFGDCKRYIAKQARDNSEYFLTLIKEMEEIRS